MKSYLHRLWARVGGAPRGFSEEIRACIPQSARVIAICNQKGGCGKTTTAVNLSAALGLKGHPNLLIDLDPQAHATQGLGVDPQRLVHTVYDIFQDPPRRRSLEEVIIPTKVPNLCIAPAHPLLSGAQLELATVVDRERILDQNIRRMDSSRFKYVFLDCSPSLNLVTINALTAADFCLVPLQPHYYALEGMKELFLTIRLTRERFNPDLKLLGIVPVLVDQRIKIVQEIMEQIRDYFKEDVLRTTVRMNSKLVEASAAGQPVMMYDRSSAGAKDYESLAEEVLLRLGSGSALAAAAGIPGHGPNGAISVDNAIRAQAIG